MNLNADTRFLKVYLPAIAGHVPTVMVKAVAALIEFYYLVRRNVIDESALLQIESALNHYHLYREVFQEVGIRPEGFSLPRQHSLVHYAFAITQFGALNGLCSSITESKHIKAVKRPYRRSSRNKPLGQMLITTQRDDKITAARADFKVRRMLDGPNSTDGLLSVLSNQDTQPNPASNTEAAPPAQVDHERHHDSRPESNPDVIAEIKLAKTHGAWRAYSTDWSLRVCFYPTLQCETCREISNDSLVRSGSLNCLSLCAGSFLVSFTPTRQPQSRRYPSIIFHTSLKESVSIIRHVWSTMRQVMSLA